jgi:hypothetical protein
MKEFKFNYQQTIWEIMAIFDMLRTGIMQGMETPHSSNLYDVDVFDHNF